MRRFYYAIQNVEHPELWEGEPPEALLPWLGGFGHWIEHDISVSPEYRRDPHHRRTLYSEKEVADYKKQTGTDIVHFHWTDDRGRYVAVAEDLQDGTVGQ